MQSFILPNNVKLSQTPGYLKVEGPFGFFIKKIGNHKIQIITLAGASHVFSSELGLASLHQLVYGVAYGFRQRLRLNGIGFRGFIIKPNDTVTTATTATIAKGFMRKRMKQKTAISQLGLKLGFSHDIVYFNNTNTKIKINVSRPESRTKGTLISLVSNNLQNLKQVASEIRSFRTPDIYNGKGIFYDNEQIKIKKGKRQG